MKYQKFNIQWMTIAELVNVNLGDLTSIVDVPLQLLLKLVNLKFNIHHPNEGYFVFFSSKIISKTSEIFQMHFKY